VVRIHESSNHSATNFGIYNPCVDLLLSEKSLVPEIFPYEDGKIETKCILVILLIGFQTNLHKWILSTKMFRIFPIDKKKWTKVEKKLLLPERAFYFSLHWIVSIKEYTTSKGTNLHYTIRCTPDLNGIAERMNWTLLYRTRALLIRSGLPKFFWNHALMTSVYSINRSPMRALIGNKTPYEMLKGEKPDPSNLRIFGCVA